MATIIFPLADVTDLCRAVCKAEGLTENHLTPSLPVAGGEDKFPQLTSRKTERKMKLIHINIGDTYILDDKFAGCPLVIVERIETNLKSPLVWVWEPARGERYPTTVKWLKPVPVSPHD